MGKLFNIFEEAYLYEAAAATKKDDDNKDLVYGAAGIGGIIGLKLASDAIRDHHIRVEQGRAAEAHEEFVRRYENQHKNFPTEQDYTNSFLNSHPEPVKLKDMNLEDLHLKNPPPSFIFNQ